MPRKLRVGVIGANYTLEAHGPAWQALGVEISAVCTAHEETAQAAAKQHGIGKAYWDYRKKVLDPDQTLAAIRHGHGRARGRRSMPRAIFSK